MKKCFGCLMIGVWLFAGAHLASALSVKVVASVNDQPITGADLEWRLVYVLHTSGMPDTQENRKQIKERVLSKMIEEKLQILEAKSRGLEPSKTELIQALSSIEQREGLASGALLNTAKTLKIPEYIVLDQVKASMVWTEVVAQHIPNKESLVSEMEVSALMKSLQAQFSEDTYTLSEFFFPVENLAQDKEAFQAAKTALEKLKKGAKFSELARHLSKSASAAQGGLIGQVIKGVFEPSLETAMFALQEGQLSEPIRGQGGYYIFYRHFNDTKEYSILQLAIPVHGDEEAHAAAELIHRLRQEKMSCSLRQKRVKELYASRVHLTLNTHVRPGQLNPKLLEMLNKQPVEQLTPPVYGGQVMLSMAVCAVDNIARKMPSREDVKNSLINQKMSQLSQRRLREVRRSSNVQLYENADS